MIVGKPLTVSEDENHVRITGEETEIIFDKKTGEFTRYQAKSVSFMTGGKDSFTVLQPVLMKEPTRVITMISGARKVWIV